MPLQQQPLTRGEMRLAQDELQEILGDAIQRHGAAEQARLQQAQLLTEQDLLEVARDLNIPEEHVAAAILERGKLKRREMGRIAARKGRWNALAAALVLLGAGIGALLVTGGVLGIAIAGVGVLATAIALIGVLLPVSDAAADAAAPPPPPGLCSVCGAQAQNPRSIFCERHRYQGPGG